LRIFHGYSACISLESACISLVSLYLAILQQMNCIPLYPAICYTPLYLPVSKLYPQLYPAVSRCISPYPRASKAEYRKKYTPGEGLSGGLACRGIVGPPCLCLRVVWWWLAFTRYSFSSRPLYKNQYYYSQIPPWFGHPTRPLHRPHYCAI